MRGGLEGSVGFGRRRKSQVGLGREVPQGLMRGKRVLSGGKGEKRPGREKGGRGS